MPKFNKGGGPESVSADKKRKDATEPKGRMNQPRGSSKHNTKPRMAKKMRNLENGSMEF